MAQRRTGFSVLASALSAEPREAMAMAARLGFSGVAFETATGGFDVAELSHSGRRDFRRALAALGLGLVAAVALAVDRLAGEDLLALLERQRLVLEKPLGQRVQVGRASCRERV